MLTTLFALMTAAPAADNVLLVVLDDVNAEWAVAAPTPVLDGLADAGVRFPNTYASPTCTPTRVNMLTGKSSRQSGIGKALAHGTDWPMQLEWETLPEYLADHPVTPYRSVAVGKWHVGNAEQGFLSPNLHGFLSYAGAPVGVGDSYDGLPSGYFDWNKIVDGVVTRTDVYATTANVDDAIAAIETLPEPWFVYLALSAAHAPFHYPPPDLVGPLPPALSGTRRKYAAMISAIDTEVGRLLTVVDPADTHIVLTSDNGAPDEVARHADRAKGSVYDGGSRVPLVVAGPAVLEPGSTSEALVHLSDVFATVADLAGAPLSEEDHASRDSVSFLPSVVDPDAPGGRAHVVVEAFRPEGLDTPKVMYKLGITDGRYKLVEERVSGTVELYDLWTDPHERTDLLAGPLSPEAALALDALEAARPDDLLPIMD